MSLTRWDCVRALFSAVHTKFYKIVNESKLKVDVKHYYAHNKIWFS